uniref:B3 domain-containing protein Os04g0386900-like isoform X2 n=1 Tax=Cicer arietinum TaxID=3827 RepID=A0A3Q7YGC4_CICAR|nr:B3 domain-containing protein Os04g0386900-like isoform X2 [Cicer arietinum]
MSSSESGRRVSSCRIVVENQTASPPPSIPTTNMQRVGIKPLSGKPYFHAIILKTHLSPRFTLGPSSKICSKLPSGAAVPTVLNYHGWRRVRF